jgi:hypothetical protein
MHPLSCSVTYKFFAFTFCHRAYPAVVARSPSARAVFHDSCSYPCDSTSSPSDSPLFARELCTICIGCEPCKVTLLPPISAPLCTLYLYPWQDVAYGVSVNYGCSCAFGHTLHSPSSRSSDLGAISAQPRPSGTGPILC